MTEHKSPKRSSTTMVTYTAAAVLAALAGFLAVYGTLGTKSNAPEKVAVKSNDKKVATPPASDRLNRGTMVGFVFRPKPKPAPENIVFKDKDGVERNLSDWRGKTVLLNLWATWCAPCRKEMPDLDRLQKELGSDKFEVVALSIDRGGLKVPKEFLTEIGVKSLKLYNDSTAKMANKFRAMGMPTTILIDPEGNEVGRLTGPAHWYSPDAIRLVKSHIVK